MGSRSTTTTEQLAYIAGFLDGDGSLMLQVKKRGDSRKGVRFMTTICLYQDTRHDQPLSWIRTRIACGYVSHRNDGMTELRVNGFSQVGKVLNMLLPYLKFKKKQATLLIRACKLLQAKTLRVMNARELQDIVELLLLIQNENYMSKKRKTKEELYEVLGLTP